MLCKSQSKLFAIFSIVLISLVVSFTLISGFEFEKETSKTIISGKYQITISGDEYKWVDTVSIIAGEVEIIAKEKIEMPETLTVYDEKNKKLEDISKSEIKIKDGFTYTMNDKKYLKIGTSSIVIIEITDADHLNSTRGWIKDAYDNISILDNITATINSEEYLRVKFKQNLTYSKDITIYASSQNNASVEVYEKDSDVLIADFGNLGSEIEMYKIYLTELNGTQDTFDLKIINGTVEFDFIIDPTLTYATVQDLYGILGDGTNRTGALNITFQIRSCNDDVCSGETFVGPDNTSSTYFTNATHNTLNEILSPNNTYFQYKSFFYTENTNYTPMLFNVTIGYTEDTTAPVISNFKFTALDYSESQIGTDQTAFNFTNLEDIEYMNISFTLTDATGITGDIKLYLTANGTNACSLGNNQSTTCYNYDSDSWIEYANGTDTSTFRDIGGSAQGDYINCDWTGTSTQRNYTCQIDEHYNPNVWKHYPLNFSDVKWQSGTNERIKKNTVWKIELDTANIPLDADYYKLDFRVNSSIGLTPSQDILTYMCNSTYSTGDPSINSNCQLVTGKTPNELQDDGTKFRGIFTKSLTSSLGDIKYVLITSDSPTSKYYSMKTYGKLGSTSVRTSISNDDGDSYSTLAGYETELNLNWFYNSTNDVTQTLFKIYSEDTLGNNANSSIQTLTWDAGDLNEKPIVDIIVPEINSNQTGILQINWTTAEPNGDSYLTNVTASNGTYTANISLNLADTISNTTWDTSTVADGLWNLTIESCENATGDLFCGNDTHQISIDNTLPNISIISPIDGYAIYDYVSGSVPVSTNFSLTETNLDSCWYTIDGGVSNTSITCLGGYNNFTFSLSSVGTFTLEISANDSAGNENSSSIQIIVSAYTGPQSGGGPSSNDNNNNNSDALEYNLTILCDKVNTFLLDNPTYDYDEKEDFRNSLGIILGYAIGDDVLSKYLTNFNESCKDYMPGENLPEDPSTPGDSSEEEDYTILFIIIAIIIILVFIIIIIGMIYNSEKTSLLITSLIRRDKQ